jgi:selenocysteine-specific elongation factor
VAPLSETITRSNLEAQAASGAVEELLAAGLLTRLENQAPEDPMSPEELVVSKSLWDQVVARVTQETSQYHKTHPLRPGLPREELKSRLKDTLRASAGANPARLYNAVLRKLAAQGVLKENGPLVLHPEHAIRFTPQQKNSIDRLMGRFAASPYAPPTLKECQAEVGEDVTQALIDLDQLVVTAPDVVFRRADYERMIADLRRLMQQNGTLTVAQVRDHFNTSRRYVLAFLEHLDAIGVTVRDGDERRLKKP